MPTARVQVFVQGHLKLLEEPQRQEILAHQQQYPEKIIKLQEVLEDPTSEDAYMYFIWREHNDLVEHVALKAYQILISVITTLYPAEY